MIFSQKIQSTLSTIVFFWLVIFGFTLLANEPDQSKIQFQKESDLLLVGKQTYFLEDKEGKLSIEDILNPEIQSRFQLNQKTIFTVV